MNQSTAHLDALTITIADLRAIDAQFWAARAKYRRGGLPTTSMSSGPGNGERPLPLPDRIDARLDHDTKLYLASLQQARTALEASLRNLRAWTIITEPIPDPDPEQCARLTCNNWVTNIGSNRLRPSQIDRARVCQRCTAHERRHGLTYPNRRTQGDAA